MKAEGNLISSLLEAPDDSGFGKAFLDRVGDILSRGLSADAWFFEECEGGSDSFPLGATSPPPSGNGDGGGHQVVLAMDTGLQALGCYRLHLAPGADPPEPSELRGIEALLRHSSRIQILQHKTHLLSRSLKLLSSFSRDMTGIFEPQSFLEALAASFRRHLGAEAGFLHILRDDTYEASFPESFFAFPESEASRLRRYADQGALPLDAPPPSLDRELTPVELALNFEGDPLGRVVLWLPGENPFSAPCGLSFLEELTGEISLQVRNLTLHRRAGALVRESQKKLQELWILQETNKALRGTLKLNRILRMILAGATADTGLGFNRAALLLLNERTGLFQGMLGVGPDSVEDADRIWKSLSRHSELDLSRQIELFSRSQPPGSRFDTLVKRLRIPLREGEGLLSHCVQTRSPVLFREGEVVELPPPERELVEKLSSRIFAATPIVSKDQVFGVMIVDNFFDDKPITEEDLRLLSTFAAQAGLAIANAKAHRAHQRAAEELRLARDQLIQSERLAVLGEVASNLAHEIRNPLVTIGGFARRLEKKIPPGDPTRKYASIIANEVQRLEQFLEEILLFGQDRKPLLKPVRLGELIADSISLYGTVFSEGGIAVKIDLAEDLPIVQADAVQLRQVFFNLFSNAVDAMGNGGFLEVAAILEPGIKPFVTTSVSDTGGGVDPKVLSSIFSPFFTTKSGGHGIGLALTQRIVIEHGGRIGVRNRPGNGLTIDLSLPAGESVEEASAAGSPSKSEGERL